MAETPVVLCDFASTLAEFHNWEGQGRRAFPKAAYVHPETLKDLYETMPAYAITHAERDVFFFGVKMLTDATLEPDGVRFVVPAYLRKKMVGVTRPPVLDTKPEYNGSGYQKPLDPMGRPWQST